MKAGLHFDNIKLLSAVLTVEYLSFKMTQWWEDFRDSWRHSGTRYFLSVVFAAICRLKSENVSKCFFLIVKLLSHKLSACSWSVLVSWCVQIYRLSLVVISCELVINDMKYTVPVHYCLKKAENYIFSIFYNITKQLIA